MTQLRKQKDAISNYFDGLLEGIGHRGSSFMDIDAVTHDAATKRWLVQEFKHQDEPLDKAQHWMLRDLSVTLPKWFTVWIVVKRDDGLIGWADVAIARMPMQKVITVREYQDRYRAWWENKSYQPATVAIPMPSMPPAPAMVPLHVDEINW